MAEVFSDSRDAGLRNIDSIATRWAERLPLSRETIIDYLSRNIHYYLDEDSIAGMQLFFRYAAQLGVLPAVPELRLVRELEIRNSATADRF